MKMVKKRERARARTNQQVSVHSRKFDHEFIQGQNTLILQFSGRADQTKEEERQALEEMATYCRVRLHIEQPQWRPTPESYYLPERERRHTLYVRILPDKHIWKTLRTKATRMNLSCSKVVGDIPPEQGSSSLRAITLKMGSMGMQKLEEQGV